MKYLTLVAIMLFFITDSYSQTYEIGPYIGGANYVGDIGSTTYINPNTLVLGAIFKWNRSKRHSFRLSILHANLKGKDANSNVGRRQERDSIFENSVTELSLGIEYTFWEWDLHSHQPQIVPYIYTGLTYFFHENDDDWKRGFSIPFILGVKGTLTDQLILAVEVGPRYTLSDNLDGMITHDNVGKGLNPNTNDWYMFTGLTLTYTFGRKPCYHNF